VKVSQSCPTLCDPTGHTVPGILHARILEWVAFAFIQGIFPTQGSNPGLETGEKTSFFINILKCVFEYYQY